MSESNQGVGIVIVSHSRPLGRAAADLASQMLPGPDTPPIEVAAGLDDTTLGTDAAAVSAAIEKIGSCDGILVLVDLGSAICRPRWPWNSSIPRSPAR